MERQIEIRNSPDYRENYANSVQVRASVWDLFISFGVMRLDGEQVTVECMQGIYLSPQQAKALAGVLSQNVAQYEQTFGALVIEPQQSVPVN